MLKRSGVDSTLSKSDLCMVCVGGWNQTLEGFFADEEGLWDRMEERISGEGWEGGVRLLGRRNDAPRLMASSDILVHPARIEGFGLVLAEAMAAGSGQQRGGHS